MNFTYTFITRPVMTTLLMAAILIFGIQSYRLLPVNDLPNVDFPTILVTASLPGASPENMSTAVATPLERQFTTIAGLDSMNSSSILGNTQITLTFNLSRNLDAAALDVQAAIARTANQLPQNMPAPPSYRKVNPADQPILFLALTSDTLPMYTIDEYGETVMAQRISTISGVAQVLVYGAQKYAVRVRLDPAALSAYGIGIDEASRAVQSANVNLPTGILSGRHKTYTIKATGQLNEAEAYKPIIVAYRKGQPVRLRDIGEAIDSVENDKTAAWYIDKRAVVLAIQRQPGTNTIEIAEAIRKLLPTFRMQIPASASLHVLYDRSESIRDSVNEVKFTLILALGLVVLVIFLFLRKLTATIIPSLAIPMSLIGTFMFMYLLNYSVDNLSLMAMILSVGFVVDDAIVMLENIVRHMEMGKDKFTAAIDGAQEIGFTIVSMTISLAAVFIPVLFMGGIIGRLFQEFAVAIGVAVLFSGFVSLTLTPMMCSRFLSHTPEGRQSRFYRVSEKAFSGMLHVYDRGLKWVLRHPGFTMLVTLMVLVAMVYMFKIIPKGFIPNEDTGQVFALTEAAESISFEAMVERQKALAAIVKEDPNVEGFFSSAGARGGITSTNSGILFMRLKPRAERKLSADELIQDLRPKLAKEYGIRAFLQNPPPFRIGGNLTKSQFQYTLQGPDTSELYQYAQILEEKMKSLPGFLDATSDLQLKNPQVNVEIDRDKATALGVSAERIEDALYTGYASRQISTIYAPNNYYQVIMEVLPKNQREPSALSDLYIRSDSGGLVPLKAVAKITQNLGPLSVNHTGQLSSVTLSFNLKPGVSLGTAVEELDKLALNTLPATISTSFQGTAQAFQSSLQGLGVLLIMAILVIYLVLGILYESFIHPVTILSALPFAGFGALATLLLFKVELNIYAFVGVIMLVGLVKKNGIMMIDFALQAQKEGMPPREAIYEACIIRFRPIMMTTTAALMGTLPLALGYGAGAESRRPLGLAVVGGLLFSQMLTLYVTPVFYLYMESFTNKIRSWFRTDSPSPAVTLEET
ncbi:MAG: efflux RND transporter permease subunit [Deltaproteobacteria bacterium]|nr:efflux RND transporter permease subunit [Deltaproteobacteria bacterium]